MVVKVFVNNESNVRLEPYRDLLHRVHAHLDNAAPNCLMYADVKVSVHICLLAPRALGLLILRAVYTC